MDFALKVTNLWVFYLLAYAIAFAFRTWANAKRGEPIEDPELLADRRILLVAALAWIIGGFVLTLFVPLNFGVLFIPGLILYILGVVIAAGSLYSLAHNRGLVTKGFYRFSRNPNYVGWTIAIFGMCLIGWSVALPSILFLLYFFLTITYFHWTISVEEEYLSNKYGDPYQEFLDQTPRYLGLSKINVVG